MYWLIAIVLYNQACDATYVISVYGDVFQDTDFFTRTFPWLIDNIGGEITVDYYLQGSGRYSVPQTCALNEIKMNTFVQAQYLKCEAEGNHSEMCLCSTGIDPLKYKHCVLTRGTIASASASKYSQLGIDVSPVIEIGYKNTIFGVEDSWYLKKICTIFGDNPPRGCIKPFACNATKPYSDKSSVVQFDCPKTVAANVRLSVTYEDKTYPVTYATENPYYTTSYYTRPELTYPMFLISPYFVLKSSLIL